MSPSQNRQLRCWVALLVKAVSLFAVTMTGLSVAANVHQAAMLARERSMAALRAAVDSGSIQLRPVGIHRPLKGTPPPNGPATNSPSGGSTSATISSASGSSSATISNFASSAGASVLPPANGPGIPIRIATQRELDGTVTLSAPSYAGRSYVMEVSLDLRTWAPILTNPATSSQIGFAVSNSSGLGMVYYRLSGTADAMLLKPGDTGFFISPTR